MDDHKDTAMKATPDRPVNHSGIWNLTLSNDNVAQAVAIASIPEDIRGYGHVKERHLKAAKEKEAALIAAFNAPAAPTGSAPRAA